MKETGKKDRWLQRAFFGVLFALSSCASPIESICIPSREARMVFDDLAAGAKDSPLKRKSPTPVRSPISFSSGDRRYQADLYRGAGPRAGILLVPGIAQRGKDDPRLVAFANTLARVGFAVLVPEMPGVRDFDARISDIQEIADAFAYLVSKPELAPMGRAGIGAHSYAVSPSMLAALRPELRGKVRFLLGIGGYHDLSRVVTFMTTGRYRGDHGPWYYRKPDPYGKWVFVASTAERLSEDREPLAAMARRKLANPEAPIEDLAAQLGPEGVALYKLLVNEDPALVPSLIAGLPSAIAADMEALSLGKVDLSSLKMRVILVHSQNDATIPFTESFMLARAFPPGQAKLFLVGGMTHVDFLFRNPLDVWRLCCALDALLRERSLGP